MSSSTSNTMTAVSYLRRSTDRQEQSINDQRRAIAEYANLHSYKLVKEYVDDAVSGASVDGRASFLKMINDAQGYNQLFNNVLVYDLKRFGRLDSDEAGYFRHQLRQAGVEIIYISEGFNGDDTDDLLRPVKQWQARQELRDLSKVTTRGLISRADGGWWVGGRPPYGYDLLHLSKSGEFMCIVRYEPNGTRLVLDEDDKITRILSKEDKFVFSKSDRSRLVLGKSERVDLIKRIYKLYTVDGFGFGGICEQLNQDGILPPTGGLRRGVKSAKWTTSSIASMLKNPLYTGDMVWNRSSSGKFHKVVDNHAVPIKRLHNNKPDMNPEQDWVVSEGTHPAIISRSTFARARKRRENTARFGYTNSHRVGRGARSSFLLTSLIRCKHCGHRWSGQTVHKGRRENRKKDIKTLYYICGSYLSKGKSACPRHSVSKDKLETWIINQIKFLLTKYFGSQDGTRDLKQAISSEVEEEFNQPMIHAKQLNIKIKQISDRISTLIDSLSPSNRDLVDLRLAELKQELVGAEMEREELESVQLKRKNQDKLFQEAYQIAHEFLQYIDQGSIDEQRELIRHFVRWIEIDPISGSGTVNLTLLPGMESEFTTVTQRKISLFKRQ